MTARRTINATSLAGIAVRRQQWACQDMVPIGTATMFAGTAGIAKSTILAHYVAGWTRGTLDGDFRGEPVNVAMISGEDDNNTILVPRLTAADADLSRVHTLGTVNVQDEDGHDWITSPNLADDLAGIREQLIACDAKVLIIDPIISLMNGDSHRLEDVRRNLDPLASMAGDLKIAVVLVAHFNKGGGNAADKVSGSHAFRDIARCLLVLAVDEETDHRILTVEKSNYSQAHPSFAFRIDSANIPTADGDFTTVGKAVPLGLSTITVQDLLRRDPTILGDRSNKVIELANQTTGGITVEDVATQLDISDNQARVYLSNLNRTSRGIYTGISKANAIPAEAPTSFASFANDQKAKNAKEATPSAEIAFPLLCTICGQPLHPANTTGTHPTCETEDK
jgi:hypothetical protein